MKFIKTKTFGAKLLSGLLSVAMILSSMPTQVYAADADIPAAEERTLTEDELAQLIASGIVIDEPVDDNVNSIPENEDGDDQTILDVDTPPNIVSNPEGEDNTTPSGTEVTDNDSSDIVDDSASDNTSPSDTTDDSINNEDNQSDNVDDTTNPDDTIVDSDGTENTDDTSDDTIGSEDTTNTEDSENNVTDNSDLGEDTQTEDNSDTVDSTDTDNLDSTDDGEKSDDLTPPTDDAEVTPTGEPVQSGDSTEDPTNTEDPTSEVTTTDDSEVDTPVDDNIAPTYNYSITLNETDINVNKGNEYTINSTISVTTTLEDGTEETVEDAEYSFKYNVTNALGEAITDTFVDDTNPITTITFNTVGNYIITAGIYDSEGTLLANAVANVTVEEELPLITFDQIYTPFDTSLVQTPDLIVKTSDPSIFTKNTNVVSNFDDAYIISCNSLDEARSVYSYYIDKVDAISDMSNVISIATDENSDDVADLDNLNDTSSDAIAQLSEIVPEVTITDYSDYIALIDTGANADVNFSVVGDDTSDSNGHGTQMLNYIKAENPNAKVMSIKVFDGSSTSAANVYAGIKLAIESKVKVINLSLVGANTEKNAIVAEVIREALDNGITVIGAAGNYNTNAKNFIPGAIDGVIVIGSIKDDYYKYPTSNYNANVYVVSYSTSEATARYTGIFTSGKLLNSEDDIWNKVKHQTIEETIHDDKKLYK